MEINNNYPVCDTDIWIKNSKHKKYYLKDLIFSKYEKIYMCDAVRQELGRERNDHLKEDFALGMKEFNKCNSDKLINMIKLNDTNYFDDEKKAAIDRELTTYNIVYNYKSGRYEGRSSDVGETITVVVASILDIPIVLCDESKASSIVWKYKYLDIRNILELLEMHHGSDIKKLQSIRKLLSTPFSESKEILERKKRDIEGQSRLSKFKKKYAS